MKIGNITTSNTKGQIVIPKKLRDDLGITAQTSLHIIRQGTGIYIYPITTIHGPDDTLKDRKAYLKVLKETRGAWAGDDWSETEKQQRTIELEATKKAKEAW